MMVVVQDAPAKTPHVIARRWTLPTLGSAIATVGKPTHDATRSRVVSAFECRLPSPLSYPALVIFVFRYNCIKMVRGHPLTKSHIDDCPQRFRTSQKRKEIEGLEPNASKPQETSIYSHRATATFVHRLHHVKSKKRRCAEQLCLFSDSVPSLSGWFTEPIFQHPSQSPNSGSQEDSTNYIMVPVTASPFGSCI